MNAKSVLLGFIVMATFVLLCLSMSAKTARPHHSCEGLKCSLSEDCGTKCWCISPNKEPVSTSNLGTCKAKEDVPKPKDPSFR